MTEDDAKAKTCQQTLGRSIAEPASYCIASACMAWRESPNSTGPVIDRSPISEAKPTGPDWIYRPINDPTSKARGEWVLLGPPVAQGFCGLAGAPR